MNSSISIITPSFNQGKYIEATIQSVISQNYEALEYFVLDGGSTDNTCQILKNYESIFTGWRSEKDEGQAAAINEGFALATGEILGWLNSDDFYLPQTLDFVNTQLDTGKPQILIGNGINFFEDKEICWASSVCAESKMYNLNLCDFIIQPSTFWTKKAWNLVGTLNTEFNYAFDWDWFIRAKNKGVDFIFSQRYLSCYRYHGEHKSSTGDFKRADELISIISTYNGAAYEKAALKIKKIVKSQFYQSRYFPYYKKLCRNRPNAYLGILNPSLIKFPPMDIFSMEKMML